MILKFLPPKDLLIFVLHFKYVIGDIHTVFS